MVPQIHYKTKVMQEVRTQNSLFDYIFDSWKAQKIPFAHVVLCSVFRPFPQRSLGNGSGFVRLSRALLPRN